MSKFKGGKWRSDPAKRSDSIRGKTISNPIPLTDDDEFPIRTPGASIATPLGTEGVEKQLQLRASALARQDSAAHVEHIAPTDFAEASRADTPPPPQPSHAPPSPPQAQSMLQQSSLESKPPSPNEGPPQRKKSSLRSVLGRLFGRKAKSSPSPNPNSPNWKAGQHRSDPTALNKTTKLSTQRSASLPINEFNRALRSHSTVIEDFPTTDTSVVNRQSIQADGSTRPRRATTPSRLWTPNKSLGYVDWTGLSPRPASSHARGSNAIPDEVIEHIGVAVTSGSHPNRRSRSVGELREAIARDVVARRRSDEIRYWRESYDPGVFSPMSSNKAEEPIVLEEPENLRDGESENAPQPFNFGPMGEMAGMKITQAASLETRVQRLEKRMHEMERAISRIYSRSSAEPLLLQDPPKRNSKRDRSTSATRPGTDDSDLSLPQRPRYRGAHQAYLHGATSSQVRSSSYGSNRPSTTSTSNSYIPSFGNVSPGFPPSVEETEPSSTQTMARPLSTSTTIRGMPSSSPTILKDGNLTGEHYTALTTMILAEQAARQDLEGLVRSLQQQLLKMRSSTITLTPALDHQRQLVEIGAAGTEFSSFEQDDSSEDEGRYEREEFQTPKEDRAHFGDEIFGDTKTAPRTLSLSQITLGQGVQPNLNF